MLAVEALRSDFKGVRCSDLVLAEVLLKQFPRSLGIVLDILAVLKRDLALVPLSKVAHRCKQPTGSSIHFAKIDEAILPF